MQRIASERWRNRGRFIETKVWPVGPILEEKIRCQNRLEREGKRRGLPLTGGFSGDIIIKNKIKLSSGRGEIPHRR
jgi:hypothetical protein